MLEPTIAEIAGWTVILAGLAYAALHRRGEGPAIAAATLVGAMTKVALLHAT